MTCVTGVSGSGKSSLVNEILFKSLSRQLNRSRLRAGDHDTIEGVEQLDKIIAIDQSAHRPHAALQPRHLYRRVRPHPRRVRRHPTTPAPAATSPTASASNVKGGRCEACSGDGIPQDRDALPLRRLRAPARVCGGKRYNRETLEVRYKGKNIYEVLEMTVDEALEFFAPAAAHRRQTADFAGCRPRLRQARPALDHALRRRGARASNWPRSFPARPRAAPSTCWTSRPRGLHVADVEKLDQVLDRPRRGGEHAGGDRTQPRRHQDGGLHHRHGPPRAATAAAR